MKNISNLDIKRHRLGLTKELSALAIVGVYKTATIKSKLEIIALIEVLKHREKNYNEALVLIFKLEKVADAIGLISKLSKQKLDAKLLSDVERLAMAPKKTKKQAASTPDIPKKKSTYYQRNKTTVLVLSVFIGVFVMILIFRPSNPTTEPVVIEVKQETFIELTPIRGQKYVYTSIDGVSTTFLLDTGASDTMVSKSYLNRHINSGFINRQSHFVENKRYIIANGDNVTAEVWKLPSITIGPKTIYNIKIAVLNNLEENGFLLGMSTIKKLGKSSIDLSNNKIILY